MTINRGFQTDYPYNPTIYKIIIPLRLDLAPQFSPQVLYDENQHLDYVGAIARQAL